MATTKAAPAAWRLRAADAADAPGLAALHTESRAVTYRGILTDDYLDRDMPAAMPALWAARMAEIAAGAGAVFVAEAAAADGTVDRTAAPAAGAHALAAFVCVLAPDAAGSALVHNLHARPGLQGGGAGTALLARAAVWARAHGARRLHLKVLEGNDRAIGFYEHRGWRLAGREPDMMDGAAVVARRYELPLD